MSEFRLDGANYIGFEYLEISLDSEQALLRLDAYRNFGWAPDERVRDKTKVILKRDRKIVNRVELTRLQRHFDACVHEIAELERSKTTHATICSIVTGLIGTAFMAGATFASVAEPPNILLAVLLALPGLIGWTLPIWIYRKLVFRRTKVVTELVEQKYDEIYGICKKGNGLLH